MRLFIAANFLEESAGDLDFLQIHSLPPFPFLSFSLQSTFHVGQGKGKTFLKEEVRKNQITLWFAKGEDDAGSGIRALNPYGSGGVIERTRTKEKGWGK